MKNPIFRHFNHLLRSSFISFRLSCWALLLISLTGCNIMYTGALTFITPSNRKVPAFTQSLNYAHMSSWITHPKKLNDAADGDFLAYQDHQASATAAVFYIHPTSYFSSKSWNQPVDSLSKDRFLTSTVLPNQLTVFIESYQIYTPKYPQATLAAFMTKSENGQQALALASDALERAFEAFIQQIGEQPFILAGHSQGSYHLIALLRRKVIGTPLQKRLIVALAPGYTFPIDYLEAYQIPLCQSDTDLGCLETWNVLKYKAQFPQFMQGAPLPDTDRKLTQSDQIAVTNPLETASFFTDATDNKGGYLGGFKVPNTPIVPHVTSAELDTIRGAVRIPKPTDKRFRKIPMGAGWYHQYEYALFFVNIKERMDRKRKVFQQREEKQ